MVSLDIEGAFDNAWWPALGPAARPWLPGEPPWPGPRLPSGPGGSRQVRWRVGRDFKGCIQGSIAGPTFWNLILDSLLRNSGNSAYTWRSRMMWSSCSPDRLSPSSQGDVGSESGDREDHIHYRDRAYRSVRFVRLGTGDEEARRAKMLDAVQRSVALKACRAHRTVSCIPRSSSRGCSLWTLGDGLVI
ncbi:hypothetical protein EVAR_89386_1 [Eumeta japonica]|uniref:Reverse transcriptase domain-containing protein n=1 Tax=Eumeta variegata TaxID=151549 RepID=A0A4C1XS65_EUMVA|nr:hypothetical protein EVAR_89386_1 [Eumeta japonica]